MQRITTSPGDNRTHQRRVRFHGAKKSMAIYFLCDSCGRLIRKGSVAVYASLLCCYLVLHRPARRRHGDANVKRFSRRPHGDMTPESRNALSRRISTNHNKVSPRWRRNDISKKSKSKRSIAVSDSPHRYGNSHAIWDHTVLPATRKR